MLLGVAERDISPRHPVQLAGFASRRGAVVSQIADPIMVRVAVLEHDGETVAVVSADLLNWSTESDERFRTAVSAATGVPMPRILFSASHNHSAPQVSHLQAPGLGVVDEGYLDHLESQVVAAAREASRTRVAVAITRASSRFPLAVNRRAALDVLPDGTIPPVDDELTAIAFRDAAGAPVAVFVHYACHPVVNSTNTVTGDYFGTGMARLKELTGAVGFPLQGCCGDVNPSSAEHADGAVRAAEIGAGLARFVSQLLDGLQTPVAPGPLWTQWQTAQLPLRPPLPSDELHAMRDASGIDGEWARTMLAHPELVRDGVGCRMQLVRLGSDLALLAMSGEMMTAYGRYIKQHSGGAVLPIGYSNGMVGYIPTAAQLDAGGYEVDESTKYYLLSAPFAPEVEPRMTESIDLLLAAFVTERGEPTADRTHTMKGVGA